MEEPSSVVVGWLGINGGYRVLNFIVNNRSHSFTLTGNTLGQNSVASSVGSVGGNACNMDWLIIPCASNVGKLSGGQSTCVDRLCGGTLNSDVSTIPATIYSTYVCVCVMLWYCSVIERSVRNT